MTVQIEILLEDMVRTGVKYASPVYNRCPMTSLIRLEENLWAVMMHLGEETPRIRKEVTGLLTSLVVQTFPEPDRELRRWESHHATLFNGWPL